MLLVVVRNGITFICMGNARAFAPLEIVVQQNKKKIKNNDRVEKRNKCIQEIKNINLKL